MPTLDYLYITRLQPFWATVECGTEKTVRDFLAQVKLSHYASGAACYSHEGEITRTEVRRALAKGIDNIGNIATDCMPSQFLWEVLGMSDAEAELRREAATLIVVLDIRSRD